MAKNSHASESLDKLIHNIGVIFETLANGVKELCLDEWSKIYQMYHINQRHTDPYYPL